MTMFSGTMSPVYTSPLPALPPGYELVPISQLTSDHEVVPWEQLPSLLKEHNMTSHIGKSDLVKFVMYTLVFRDCIAFS